MAYYDNFFKPENLPLSETILMVDAEIISTSSQHGKVFDMNFVRLLFFPQKTNN